MIFPWQQKQWQQLLTSKQENRLPHALLFTGIAGIGKAQFAQSFSQLILCENESACNTCHACRLVFAKTHPNLLWVEPESGSRAIKVEQIRVVIDFVNQSALQGEHRIVIIHPANAMNANAANALLKTLEEPAAGAMLILLSDQRERLPATIRSRCQSITFPLPNKLQALSWLMDQSSQHTQEDWERLLGWANGAPLKAMETSEIIPVRQTLFATLYALIERQMDPLQSANKLQDTDVIFIIDCMLSWIMDLLRLQLVDNEIVNKDYIQPLSELQYKTQTDNNIHFMEYLQYLRAQISSGINLNKQLLLEDIFIRWMRCA